MAVADHHPARPQGRLSASMPRGTTAGQGTALAREGLPFPVVIYLFCLVVPIWFNAGPLLLSTLRLYLLVMIIPLLVQLLMGRFGRILITDVLFIAHLAWATLALAINNPTMVVGQFGSVGVEFLGGYMVGRAYIRTPAAFFALCRWIVVIILCLAPFAIIEALTARRLILETLNALPGVSSLAIVNAGERLGLQRVQAVFTHPIHFGLFCSVGLSLAFVALRDQTTTAWRWTSAVLIGLTGFLGLSSGAFLAILLQVALIAWAAIFHRNEKRWWLLVALFAVAYVVVDVLSDRTPIRVFMSYATFSAHNAYWRSIIFEWGLANVIGSAEKGIVGSPWFGIGLNNWIRPSFMFSGSMDNFWLVMAVRYGLPGFLLLVVGYAWAVSTIMRRNFTQDPVLALIRRAWVFTFLGLSFTLCTVHVWNSVYSFVFMMFGAGIWLIAAQPAAREGSGAGAAAGAALRAGPRYSRFPAATAPRRTPA